MAISNLPAQIQQIIQDGWLLRFFNDALQPKLLYRGLYEGFETPMHLGQSFTFSKKGLLPLVQSAMAPSTVGDITNGLTPVRNSYEQYSVTMSQYAQTVATNMLSSAASIVNLYADTARDLGQNAGASLDVQARRRLFQAYRGGRTFITGAETAQTDVDVNDISGLDFVYVNGVRQVTSVSNPHPVKVLTTTGEVSRNVTAVVSGTLNIDEDNITGTITLSSAVTVAVGAYVLSDYRPHSIRPNARATSYQLTASDVLTFQNLVDASQKLRSMGVPTHDDGFYHAILDSGQVAQLFADQAFQRVYDTHADSEEFQKGSIGIAGGMKIFETNQAPNGENPGDVLVRRGIVTGAEMGYEAQYAAIARWLESSELSANGAVVYSPQAHVAMVLRNPLDQLQQEVYHSWSFIGDWVAATDTLSTLGSSTAYYKRAVMLETA